MRQSHPHDVTARPSAMANIDQMTPIGALSTCAAADKGGSGFPFISIPAGRALQHVSVYQQPRRSKKNTYATSVASKYANLTFSPSCKFSFVKTVASFGKSMMGRLG